LLDSARADIATIHAYIEETSGSSTTAARFARQLNRQCRRLAELPGTLGRPRPELRRDLRSQPYGNYVIFFHYVGDVLEIVNILEGHRDIEAYFGDEQQG
jgi:toxin ParE1/3/4